MKRVFIVGCPRSGTTLLQTLLAANGRLVSPPETHFFNYLVPRSFARYLGVASRSGRDRILQHMEKIGVCFRAPTTSWMSDWTDALVECLDEMALAESVNGWIEKTPVHLHFIELIEKFIPDALFLHIVRNGKDTSASLYEAARRYPDAWSGNRTARQCAERWAHDVTISIRLEGHQRHKVVTYEKLVAQPNKVISACLDFMSIDKHPHLLPVLNEWSSFHKAVLPNEPWKEFKSGVEGSPGKFQSVFSKEQQLLVTSIVASVFTPH
jgi:LPS sulfotransferase NodH